MRLCIVLGRIWHACMPHGRGMISFQLARPPLLFVSGLQVGESKAQAQPEQRWPNGVYFLGKVLW